MNLVLLGAPGAGKGTQAKKIQQRFHIPHLSVGDLLRNEVSLGSFEGRKASEYMNKGDLVPDELVIFILKKEISKLETGFILDGFPRTTVQAEALETFMHLDAVINIHVDFDRLVSRLTGRRSCPQCGAIYHIRNNPPSKEGICDNCNANLQIRKDDTQETVRNRIETYVSFTQPLVEYYEKKGILKTIDGNQEITEIFQEIENYLVQLK